MPPCGACPRWPDRATSRSVEGVQRLPYTANRPALYRHISRPTVAPSPLLAGGRAVDDFDHGVQKPPATPTALVGVALKTSLVVLLVYQDDGSLAVGWKAALWTNAAAALFLQALQPATYRVHAASSRTSRAPTCTFRSEDQSPGAACGFSRRRTPSQCTRPSGQPAHAARNPRPSCSQSVAYRVLGRLATLRALRAPAQSP